MKLGLLIFLTFIKISTFGKVIGYTFNEQCKKATEIFTGRVVKLTLLKEANPGGCWSFGTYEIQFVTTKVWKGMVRDTMTCIASESICSPNIFDHNKVYLVYSENGKITLGAGRSRNIEHDFIRSEMTKLTLRYLFRRPHKLSGDFALTMVDELRQPIRAHYPSQPGQVHSACSAFLTSRWTSLHLATGGIGRCSR